RIELNNYIKKFEKNYTSVSNLKQEAQTKIKNISKYLLEINKQYNILPLNEKNYLQGLIDNDPSSQSIRDLLIFLDEKLSFIPLMLPMYNLNISSKYGKRYHPIRKHIAFHSGLDMVANYQAPVYSSANGIVTFVGTKAGYGKIVEVKHSNNIKTRYAHLAKILVKTGHKIARGKILGIQGSTGNSINDHLHFEILINNKHINPYNFIKYECLCRSANNHI
ncbi:MAG: M23 family metallopeptidase, partial [Chitinophagaceae bacterium]|nr:M23 family metallopeptidase [Chitinophagaceae bacterium]